MERERSEAQGKESSSQPQKGDSKPTPALAALSLLRQLSHAVWQGLNLTLLQFSLSIFVLLFYLAKSHTVLQGLTSSL